MAHTPLILVCGALGSGKTTFVRAVIAANPDVRFGVIVNEFGEAGIDGDLLRPFVPQIIEIRNGCICCATQDQFVPAVKELLARYVVDVLIIEMSGAGDPVPVERNLSVLRPTIEVHNHVVIVDSAAEPGAMTRDQNFRNSLAVSDLAILTKTDIASAAGIAAWRTFLAAFVCDTEVVEAIRGNIPLAHLLGAGPRVRRPLTASALDRHEHKLASICHFIDATTRESLQRFVDCYGSKVERFKGILWVDNVLTEVQGVREHLSLEPYRGAPSRGRLVFISSKLAQPALRTAVRECFAMDDTAVLPVSLDHLAGQRRNGNAMPEQIDTEPSASQGLSNGRQSSGGRVMA